MPRILLLSARRLPCALLAARRLPFAQRRLAFAVRSVCRSALAVRSVYRSPFVVPSNSFMCCSLFVVRSPLVVVHLGGAPCSEVAQVEQWFM